jgi:DNA polymerase III alpha subunit
MGMDARYCKRKKGEEPFNIHPVMQPSSGHTYGVLIFQEQVMDILRVVGKIPDMHTEKVRKAISKKKIKDFEKYQEQFIENGQRVLNVNAEYVINLWDQIEAFAEYGFNASHAYAYAYISARLLWLKAHYPLEFYTAILMCEDDDREVQGQYKLDAKYHDIKVCPVHINKSRVNFGIDDAKIFFGFSNIKKIGEGVAERIVQSQPYKDFPDFLEKFGTDATPIKALTALGVFEDAARPHHAAQVRRVLQEEVGVAPRLQEAVRGESMDKKIQELREKLLEEVKEDDPDFEKMCDFTEEAEVLWQDRFQGIMRKVPYKYKGEDRVREVAYLKQLQDLAKKRAEHRQVPREGEGQRGRRGLDVAGRSTRTRSSSTRGGGDPHRTSWSSTGRRATRWPSECTTASSGRTVWRRARTTPGRTIDKFFEECENEGWRSAWSRSRSSPSRSGPARRAPFLLGRDRGRQRQEDVRQRVV